MARPSADGFIASHFGPSKGDDASKAGPYIGNLIPHGGIDPFTTSSSTATSAATADHPHLNLLLEQDHFILVGNVNRIMRRVLLMLAKISDGAKEMMQECVSEYINLITSATSERTQDHYRERLDLSDGKAWLRQLRRSLRLYIQCYCQAERDQCIGLCDEHFPINRYHRHALIRDTNRVPPLHAQSLLIS